MFRVESWTPVIVYFLKMFSSIFQSYQKVSYQKWSLLFSRFQDLFVKVGQTLRLDSMLTSGSQLFREPKAATKSPWEPSCVYANFPHQVLCGDSWGNFAMLLGTTSGTFLLSLNTKTSVSYFHRFWELQIVSWELFTQQKLFPLFLGTTNCFLGAFYATKVISIVFGN